MPTIPEIPYNRTQNAYNYRTSGLGRGAGALDGVALDHFGLVPLQVEAGCGDLREYKNVYFSIERSC